MARKKVSDFRKSVNRCKKVLEDYLLNAQWIPICSETSTSYLDSHITNYLKENNQKEFLEEGFYNRIVEKAMIEFARNKRVFNGKAGRYKIEETYGVHSVRLFQAIPD